MVVGNTQQRQPSKKQSKNCSKKTTKRMNSKLSENSWHSYKLMQFLGCFVFIIMSGSVRAQINVENVITMGRHALSVDDNISAIRYFTQAIEARPTHSRAYYLRAYAKFILEDYGGAEADCTKSIELNPFIAETYQLRGLCRLHIKDFRGSISDYSYTLRELPKDEAALFNTALCHTELHEPDSAEMFIDKFLEESPKFYRAYILKAQIALEERHDTLHALALADTIIALHREEPIAWLLKGEQALKKKDYALADSFLTEAIRYQQPPNFMHHLMRAEVRHSLNLFGAALEDYDKVIEIIPEHFVAHYNRGLLRALVGDDNRAIEDFDFVLNVEPDNTLARYNRAMLREQTGDLRGAIADYSDLIRSYPDFLYGYHARAQLRRKLGDHRGAMNDETILARHNLDVAFAKPRRHNFRKVRKRSEHELDKYDQPIAAIESNNDTVRIFGDNIFGKVQNIPVSLELMPPPMLTLLSAGGSLQNSITPLEELEKLSRKINRTFSYKLNRRTGERLSSAAKLCLTANFDNHSNVSQAIMLQRIDSDPSAENELSPCDKALLKSVLLRQSGDISLSRIMCDSAVIMQPEAMLPRLNRISLLMLQLPEDKKNIEAEALIKMAEADISFLEQHAPPHAAVCYAKGCLLATQGRYTESLKAFDDAIALDNEFAEAYYNRALARQFLGGETHLVENDLSHAGELGLHAAYGMLKQIRRKP